MQAESTERQKSALTAIFVESPSPGSYWSMNLNKFAQRALFDVCVCVPKGSIMNRAFVVTKRTPKSLSPAWANMAKWGTSWGTGFFFFLNGGETRKLSTPSWCNVWKMLPSRCKLCHLGHKRLQLWRPCVGFHFFFASFAPATFVGQMGCGRMDGGSQKQEQEQEQAFNFKAHCT